MVLGMGLRALCRYSAVTAPAHKDKLLNRFVNYIEMLSEIVIVRNVANVLQRKYS
jgi:hypothetical protein